jgi:hypothetical protein
MLMAAGLLWPVSLATWIGGLVNCRNQKSLNEKEDTSES